MSDTNAAVATAPAEDSALASANFGDLLTLGQDAAPATAVEKVLSTVAPTDAVATTPETAQFQFRSLLTQKQRDQLKQSAPDAATKMLNDYNLILQFGKPVLDKLNSMSIQMLAAQKDIEIPGADQIVNDMLREIDGYQKKYRNVKMENANKKVFGFFKSTKYTFKTMVRETKPISDKLDMAEVKLKEMEIKLADNVTRGQQLRKNTTEILDETVTVLAALEQILEEARVQFKEVDDLVKANTPDNAGAQTASLVEIEFKGQKMTLQELQDLQAQYATGVTELEKSWSDWRSQFFLGYAQAPSVRNLIMVSASMQRRCQSFRTMGIPSARSSLVLSQQAALAKQGAEMGAAVQDGVNKLVQQAFSQTAEAVAATANAAQAPMVTPETINAVIQSVKDQCNALVTADRQGRALRAKNLAAMEAGERAINATTTDARNQLVKQVLEGTATPAAGPAAAPVEDDILGKLGAAGKE